MEQRPLRLGDNVDDYCPRERRITNHVIVAIVGESIRQTRCSACDAEHVYKEGKVPRRKKKDDPEGLYDQVLADLTGGQLVRAAAADAKPAATTPGAPMSAPAAPMMAAPAAPAPAAAPADDESTGNDREDRDRSDERPDTIWPAHRTLIRATLPRTGDEPPVPRPIPEFTMHQRQTRGAHAFRQAWHGGGGNNGQPRQNGFRPDRPGRPGGGQPSGNGNGNGPEPGNGGPPGPGARRHGRHRSRHKRAR